MIGTISGIIIAIILYYYPVINEDYQNLNILTIVFLVISILLLAIYYITYALAWSPLQKMEKVTTPHVLTLLKNDKQLNLVNIWFFLFILLTFLVTFQISLENTLNKTTLLAIWVILFGFSIDVLYFYFRRILGYFNPFTILQKINNEGLKCIQEEREIDLGDWIDANAETAIKGIQNTNPSLTNNSLDAVQLLIKNFLEYRKSLTYHKQESQTQALGINDSASYILYYFFQRLELIHEKALERKLELVSSHVITTLGKIIIYCAKFDMSLTTHPLYYLGKFTKRAQEKGFTDVGVRATLTLLEVAKTIIAEIDLTYLELTETFLGINGRLEDIAKETFKQDKSTSIKILMQPFLTLKDLFKSEKVANHQDTPVILNDIDRVIAEFQNLEVVLRTIPPIPTEIKTDMGMGSQQAQTQSVPKAPTPQQKPPQQKPPQPLPPGP